MYYVNVYKNRRTGNVTYGDFWMSESFADFVLRDWIDLVPLYRLRIKPKTLTNN